MHDCSCKIGTMIRQYNLDTMDPLHDTINEGLVARWNGNKSHTSCGYRTLTDWFNMQMLKSVYQQNGEHVHDTQIEAEYKVLTGEDEVEKQEIIHQLDTIGVDGSQMQSDFVSWATMRNHLLDCLSASKERPSGSTNWEQSAIKTAQSMASKKIGEALSSLSSSGDLVGFDEASVSVNIQLQCDHCPTRVPLSVALERGYICKQHHASESAKTQP